MCFHSQQQKSPKEIAKRFALPEQSVPQQVSGVFNGFNFPLTPVISNLHPAHVQLFNWGLIPHWAKNDDIKKYTLNAKIETLNQKPSFRDAVTQRCLILSTGFFEWQWLDTKGTQKQKYLITVAEEELFAFAGIWSKWKNPMTNETHHTYAIITTQANTLMQEIHNTKQRMPVIIPPGLETDWLQQMPLDEAKQFSIDLKATPV